MKKENKNIVLFDGVCNMCNASVQFIIKHDSNKNFHFVSQTSSYGQALFKSYELEDIDSICLLSENKIYIYSDAILEVSKKLDGCYRHFYLFRFVPKVLRDGVYKFVAKYRYKVFGKKDSCMIPSAEVKDRFLGTF